jgi:MFS family permease
LDILFSIWFLYFASAFQSTVTATLNPYVTSSFQKHSLSAVPTALGDAFAAATYLPVAKMMDVWGRAEGFLLMVVCATVGLVLMASCHTFEIYCAANVSLYNLPSI